MSDPTEILRARARRLAKPVLVEAERAPGALLEVLVVHVDRELIAFPLDSIAAIARPSRISPLPRAVAPLYGITVWRGRPLTVLGLGAGAPTLGADSRLVVLGDARRAELGILVDAVDDVRIVDREALAPSGNSGRGSYALGITEDALLVLDVAAFLRAQRLATTDSPDRTRIS
jgi:chemotaxis signal transduction protein